MQEETLAVRDGLFQAQLFRAGSGDPLLYLHGSGGLTQGAYLDALAERFAVYAPVHPGFGTSTGDEHIVDIIDLALYYHDVLDALGLASAHVVGHSLGGMLAAELAALCSHRVRKLVLANAVGFWRDDDPVLDFFSLPPEQLIARVVHDVNAPATREAFKVPENQDELVEALFNRAQSFAVASKYLWPIPDRGLKRRIHRIQSPTLIIWGKSDGLVGPGYAEEFRARIKDARVVILEQSGHMPMFEQRDEFVAAITDFLSA
jgi:pimeloyl-ACP methyl ester carboxylesterase